MSNKYYPRTGRAARLGTLGKPKDGTTQMTTMIERVAIAICFAGDPNGISQAWEYRTEENRDIWRLCARAAIKAMREPTMLMVGSGLTTYESLKADEGANVYRAERIIECYGAMIDTALSEDKTGD